MNTTALTPAELALALQQQQAENAALHAELAQLRAAAAPPPALPKLLPVRWQLVRLMEELYPAVVFANPDGCIVLVSEGFRELYGLEPRDAVGQYAADVLRPTRQGPHTLAYINAQMAAHAPFQYEVETTALVATQRWLRVKVQPIYNEQREVVMLACMLEDITDWKQTQLTLAESERRFQALAENAPGVLYEWRKNHDGTFEFGYVSPKLQELFGMSADDITRMPEFMHPEEVDAFLQSMVHAVTNVTSWSYEGRVVVPGQPIRWMQGNSVVTGTDARGVCYSGILQDVTPLKQAQLALRESDIRLRLTVEGFGDGAWEMNVQSREIFFSTDYKVMLGYHDEEFSNDLRNWEMHVHPDDLEEVRRVTIDYLCSPDSPMGAVEFRLRCKDGSYKWVLNRALITARDDAGQPLMLTGLQTDISELKQAQEALEVSNRRLLTVIANFQAGLVLEDENREIVLTNEAFCNLLVMPTKPDQLEGKSGAWLAEGSRRYVANPNQYVARITALLRRKAPVVGDIVPLLDGRLLQRDYTPIYDQDRYIGQLWKFEDITVRTRAEADLRQREEKYRRIIENMSLGLVEADLDDHLLYANQSFCEMTGYCNAELTGHRLSPMLLSGEALELVESKLKTRKHGIADSYEISFTTKSGELKWLLVSGAPVYNELQQPVGSIGIYLDVTPQKQLQDSLREAKGLAEISSRAKQEFLANMSHEIRTPMNAILGMSQLLAKTALDGVQESYLHAITASAENLLVIINDILDLSKIEAGHMSIEKIGFDPSRVCAQVEQTVHYKAEEKGLCFESHLDPALPTVLLGDPYRITQILLNLTGNSVKFTEKGQVRLTCALVGRPTPAEALVEFTVEDTGIGIEAEYLARVFDDFSQEDSSVTRRFGGTGLGLGISKKLVELLGGELHIESQKNHGTISRFTLRLPVGTPHDVPQKDGTNISGMTHALRGKRVLLVEDNLFNRLLANIFLSNVEMEVTEAENGMMAVAVARAQPFDLILMDVQMPVMNGYEATAIIREELGKTTPIIALTANAIMGEREKCIESGMNDYITKPFQEDVLIKMVYDWVVKK